MRYYCSFCPNSGLSNCSGGFCSSAYEIMVDTLGYDPTVDIEDDPFNERPNIYGGEEDET